MTVNDSVIASIGLPKHGGAHKVSEASKYASTRAGADGDTAIDRASVLAARGYASVTMGDGGSRGSDTTSSTERHAAKGLEGRGEDARWFGVDVRLAQALRDLERASVAASSLIDEIMRQAMDVDPIPSGTGECPGCGRFCRPSEDKPGNRIVKGMCRASCYPAWDRAGRPPRSDWLHERRRSFTDDQGLLHTPDPDPDVDLSRELPVSAMDDVAADLRVR